MSGARALANLPWTNLFDTDIPSCSGSTSHIGICRHGVESRAMEQGHDRFRIQPHHSPYGRYRCSVCGPKGNAITYLIDKRGFSKQEALIAVGWKSKDGSEPRCITPDAARDARHQWDEPSECWQYAARDFYCACHETLWSAAGQATLDDLRVRGFTTKLSNLRC